MSKFICQIQEIGIAALGSIKKILSDKTSITLWDDKSDEDLLYDLPTIGNESKHGHYANYAVISIHKEDKGELYFKGKGMGDAEEEYDFRANELTVEDICYIEAYIINQKAIETIESNFTPEQ